MHGCLAGEGPRCHESPVWGVPRVTVFLVAGTAAMRNTKRGSWYIEALAQVFSQRACDMHVADMLVKVSLLVWLREPLALPSESAPPPSSLALFFTVSALLLCCRYHENTQFSDFGPLVSTFPGECTNQGARRLCPWHGVPPVQGDV